MGEKWKRGGLRTQAPINGPRGGEGLPVSNWEGKITREQVKKELNTWVDECCKKRGTEERISLKTKRKRGKIGPQLESNGVKKTGSKGRKPVQA